MRSSLPLTDITLEGGDASDSRSFHPAGISEDGLSDAKQTTSLNTRSVEGNASGIGHCICCSPCFVIEPTVSSSDIVGASTGEAVPAVGVCGRPEAYAASEMILGSRGR
jgi:hypothetical protein